MQVDAFSVNCGEMLLLEDRGPGSRSGKDIAALVVQAAADPHGGALRVLTFSRAASPRHLARSAGAGLPRRRDRRVEPPAR